MEKDIAVQVSREGNITLTVPETVNSLTKEKANLLGTLLTGAIADSEEIQILRNKIEVIVRPYNTTGRKISEVASKIRDVEPSEKPVGVEKITLIEEEEYPATGSTGGFKP